MERGLDAYKLKLIAIPFMLLDHIYSIFSYAAYDNLNWPLMPGWISLITRFVWPLFIYLMIDGFYHTRSRIKYLLRLVTAALIMFAGTTIIYQFFDKTYFTKYSYMTFLVDYNIFTLLALMFAFIWCLDNIKRKNHIIINVLLAIVIAFASLLAGGLIVFLPMPIIMWAFYGRKNKQCIGIFIYSLLLFIMALKTHFTIDAEMGLSLYDRLCMDCEWAVFTVIPFILAYNGERGKNTKFTKYLFYVFFPLHIWILIIASFIIEKL